MTTGRINQVAIHKLLLVGTSRTQ
jgi:hypothetical protein